MTDYSGVRSFEIGWTQADLDPLRASIQAFRWPPRIPDSGWDYGCDPDFLHRFCTHWTDRYDMAAAVDQLNHYPQITARIDARIDLHAVHVPGDGPDPVPLLLLHGWPAASTSSGPPSICSPIRSVMAQASIWF